MRKNVTPNQLFLTEKMKKRQFAKRGASFLVILASLALVILIIGVGAFFYWKSQLQPADPTRSQLITIQVKAGMNTADISSILMDRGLIRSGTAFQIAARLKGLEKSLQAGEYAFSPRMSTVQVIEMLARGETAYYQFTIPEGFTVEQIADLLQEKGLANKERFLSLARNYAPFEYMENRPGTKYRVEGYLFPDTYRVSRGMSEEDLLKMLTAQFDRAYSPEMRDKAKLAGISVHNLVTLGSLVEREARLTQERPMVARVFLNRLKVDMPLQSCATIQYILGYPKEELTIADTQLPSPYNTYLNGGLPPGPVASPGLAALQAVLAPTDGDWLFFVVDGKTGGHRFSKTLAEHEAAIAKIGQ